MFVVAIAILLSAALIFSMWLIGTAWNYVFSVRDGRPILTKGEQLAIDIMRAQGWSHTAARRDVISRRTNGLLKQSIQLIRETDDLILNPARADELREACSTILTGDQRNGKDHNT